MIVSRRKLSLSLDLGLGMSLPKEVEEAGMLVRFCSSRKVVGLNDLEEDKASESSTMKG